MSRQGFRRWKCRVYGLHRVKVGWCANCPDCRQRVMNFGALMVTLDFRVHREELSQASS